MTLHRLITADKALRNAGLVGLREGRFGGARTQDPRACQSTEPSAKISFAPAYPWSPIKGGTP